MELYPGKMKATVQAKILPILQELASAHSEIKNLQERGAYIFSSNCMRVDEEILIILAEELVKIGQSLIVLICECIYIWAK